MNIQETNSPEDLQDLGQYFRGLLLVMASDGELAEEEIRRITSFGLECGFSESFIQENLDNVLTNKHLEELPPRFHSEMTARRFLFEAAEIAACDGELHTKEREWLLEAARLNGISKSDLESAIETVRKQYVKKP